MHGQDDVLTVHNYLPPHETLQAGLDCMTRAIKRYNAFDFFVFIKSAIYAFSAQSFKTCKENDALGSTERKASGGGARNAKRKSSQHSLVPPEK